MPVQLPLDVIIHVLSQLFHLQAPDNDRVATLQTCSEANSLFREAAWTASLWEPYYKARYRHSNPENESHRWEELSGNWRRLYSRRMKLDLEASRLLDQIVDSRLERYNCAGELADLSFDVWDFLEAEVCACENAWKEKGGTAECCPWTRRHWAQAMMEVISRADAIKLWSGFIIPGFKQPSFDETMCALSCFFGKLRSEIKEDIDQIAEGCPAFLRERGLPLEADNKGYNLAETCRGIIEYMTMQGFGPAESFHFFNVLNQFPHAYLTTNKHAIPISLVHIFVAIAQRLGINASPVDFPGRVLVHVAAHNGSGNDVYLDVFASDANPILDAQNDVPAMLMRMGLTAQAIDSHLLPSSGQPMLLRVARNILSASRQAGDLTEDVAKAAIQMSLSVHLLLTNETRLITHLLINSELRPLECSTYLSKDLACMLPHYKRAMVEAACGKVMGKEEEERQAVCYRVDAPIRYFVGAVFRHVRYSYIGCVVGWDNRCNASDEWIRQMGVDLLPRGRSQPFYRVFVADGTSRYVAEKNINLIHPTKEIVSELFENNSQVSLAFEGADLNEESHGRGRLLLSPEMRFSHPDDDDTGKQWVKTGMLLPTIGCRFIV